jgi:hypothetical protein
MQQDFEKFPAGVALPDSGLEYFRRGFILRAKVL